jgi:hypothetical protein
MIAEEQSASSSVLRSSDQAQGKDSVMNTRRRSGRHNLAGTLMVLAFATASPGQSLVQENPVLPIQSESTSVLPGSFTGFNAGRSYTLWDTISQSICGKPDPARPWTPLYAATFFSEGWREPWIGPPNGPGGSLRQGWVGVPDAFFNRQVVGIYSNTRGANGAQNEQVGAFLVESPLSRRYDLGVIVPFVDYLEGAGQTSATSFGDVTIENRFLLHETESLTVSLNLNVRVPTGQLSTGNDRTVMIPYIAFYKDFTAGFSVRGAVGAEVPLDSNPNPRITTLTQSLAIGQTVTPHDIPFFGDFTYYVCANVREGLNSSNATFLSVAPGIRTHLGGNWFLLAGLEIPVTNNQAIRERLTFVLVKGF